MDYIYIDESGELAKQTNYFVFGAVITNNPSDLEKIINKTRRKYQKQLGNISEIKGYSTDDYIIKKMLKKLDKTSSKVVGIILDKRYIYRIHQNQNYNILYDTLASELAKEITINDSTSIIIDKCKNKEYEIINFNKKFVSNLNNIKNYPVNVKHANSTNYKGLQIADIVAWSIFQSVERNNSDFIDLIEDKTIKKVFEE